MPETTTFEQLAIAAPEERSSARAMVVLHLDDHARVLQLAEGQPRTVGREFPSNLVIADRTLSRQHARFLLLGGELAVDDLGSRNGTWVRGEAVKRAVLHSGEEFRLGALTATAHLMAPAARDTDSAADPPAAAVLRSPRMLELYERIDQIANTTIPVLISGETGTGKELVAEALHRRSDRRGQPFRVVNCAAIPQALAESVLFGHERGAFTGANSRAEGVFQQAAGGVVFLDEVGELSPAIQAMLLRTLETKTVQPVGSRHVIPVDVRIVSATHRDLLAAVAGGAFREDLYYRINGITLRVPPLRERREEIVPLAQRFVADAARAWKRPARRLDAELCARLESLPWPGNVRQLRHAIEQALVICRGDSISLSDLPFELLSVPEAERGPAATSAARPDAEGAADFKSRVREYEKRLITDALHAEGGNQRAAARRLQMPLRTLAHKLSLYAIRVRSRGDRSP